MRAATARSAPGQRRAARENEVTTIAHRVRAPPDRAHAPRPAGDIARRDRLGRSGARAERGTPHRLRQRHDGDPLRPRPRTSQPPRIRHHQGESRRPARVRGLASVSAVHRSAGGVVDRHDHGAGLWIVQEERHGHPSRHRRNRTGLHPPGDRDVHPALRGLGFFEPRHEDQGVRQVRDRRRHPRVVERPARAELRRVLQLQRARRPREIRRERGRRQVRSVGTRLRGDRPHGAQRRRDALGPAEAGDAGDRQHVRRKEPRHLQVLQVLPRGGPEGAARGDQARERPARSRASAGNERSAGQPSVAGRERRRRGRRPRSPLRRRSPSQPHPCRPVRPPRPASASPAAAADVAVDAAATAANAWIRPRRSPPNIRWCRSSRSGRRWRPPETFRPKRRRGSHGAPGLRPGRAPRARGAGRAARAGRTRGLRDRRVGNSPHARRGVLAGSRRRRGPRHRRRCGAQRARAAEGIRAPGARQREPQRAKLRPHPARRARRRRGGPSQARRRVRGRRRRERAERRRSARGQGHRAQGGGGAREGGERRRRSAGHGTPQCAGPRRSRRVRRHEGRAAREPAARRRGRRAGGGFERARGEAGPPRSRSCAEGRRQDRSGCCGREAAARAGAASRRSPPAAA